MPTQPTPRHLMGVGLVSSTLLTLLVLPAVYMLIWRRREPAVAAEALPVS